MSKDIKKQLILNSPYIIFVYLFDKLSQSFRIINGDMSFKVLHIGAGLKYAFSHPLPSFHLIDIAIGIAGAVIVRLLVYFKGKNAKKYRQGNEYGSARWDAYYQL